MKQKIRFPDFLLPFSDAKRFSREPGLPFKTRVKELIKEYCITIVCFILALIALAWSIVSGAQEKLAYHKLNTGDAVPGITISNVINYRSSTLRLSDFKGKLLIIDFWGTYCAPCIRMIPKMDSLQMVFGDKLQFLPVTPQNAKVIGPFLTAYYKQHTIRNIDPCVTDDHTLSQLFPYNFVPHYVWISPGGRVLAFTSDADVTEAHIRSVLETGKLEHYTAKYDIDVNKPLYTSAQFPVGQMVDYTLLVKGHLEGTGAGTHLRRTSNSVGVAMTNIPLGDLYEHCGRKLIKGFSAKNLILRLKDTADLFYAHGQAPSRAWFWKHEFSIDVIVPVEKKDSLYYDVLRELNRNGRYSAHLERRETNFLKLVILDGSKQFLSGGGNYRNTLVDPANRVLLNGNLNNLTAWLNEEVENIPIVIDGTHVTQAVSLRFSAGTKSLPILKKELNQQGLDLVHATGPLEFMIINDKNFIQP